MTAARRPLHSLTLIALLLVAPAVAGCGGGEHALSTAASSRPAGGYLAGADLERQLGNAFRKGLYRLAVMSQKSEDAMDLGQPLPTGLVREVSCESAGAQPAGGRARTSNCTVRWKTVEGRGQVTRYAVRLTPGNCFSAGATPQRGPRYDSTIRTYAVDPLNVLGTYRRGC